MAARAHRSLQEAGTRVDQELRRLRTALAKAKRGEVSDLETT